VKVLVTGATGFVGMEVARQLAWRGWQPRLAVRRVPRGALLTGLDAEPVYADLLAPDTLHRAVAGCDAVLHLGGRAVLEPARRLVDTFVHGTRALAEAAADAGVRQFVFASSMLVHGSQPGAITAATPPRPAVDYGRVKLLVERRLTALGARTGMGIANVRLPHVYGPHDQIFARVRRGWVMVPGRGSASFGHLHVRDAARVLIAAAEQGWSGASVVGDHEPVGWDVFFGEIDRLLPGLHVVRIPQVVARAGTEALTITTALRSRPMVHTPDVVVSWNLSLPVDPTALWGELGIGPELPTYREGIAATLDDQVAFRWRHPIEDTRR
jgi:nucleoside-diphosphate-sugar epimerase